MKKVILFLTLIITLNSITLSNKSFGRSFSLKPNSFSNIKEILTPFTPRKNGENRVIGCPYLCESFKSGYIFLTDTLNLPKVELRYNVFYQQMEVKIENDYNRIARPDLVTKIQIGKQSFVYKTFEDENKRLNGFLREMYTGKSNFYIRHECKIIGANLNALQSGAETEKDRYRQFKYYCIQLHNTIPVKIRPKKNKVLKLLVDKKKTLNKFIKDNRLNIRDEEDMITLITYYDTLKK